MARIVAQGLVVTKANSTKVFVRIGWVSGSGTNTTAVNSSRSVVGISWATSTVISETSPDTLGWAIIITGGKVGSRAGNGALGAMAENALGVLDSGLLVPARISP